MLNRSLVLSLFWNRQGWSGHGNETQPNHLLLGDPQAGSSKVTLASSWAEGLRRRERGFPVTGKLDRPGRWASSGPAPAAQPPPAMGLEVSLSSSYRASAPSCGCTFPEGRQRGRVVPHRRPEAFLGGEDSLWAGESGGPCQGVGAAPAPFCVKGDSTTSFGCVCVWETLPLLLFSPVPLSRLFS